MIKEIWEFIISLIFPRRCPVCDRPVNPFGELICLSCEEKVHYLQAPFCMKCGKKIQKPNEAYCEDCKRIKHMYDKGYSLFEYGSVAQSLYRFKYEGRREYGAYYGERMATLLGKEIRSLSPQAIVPVPVHITRKIERGYNQAEILAKELGKRLQIPVDKKLIKRVKKTVPQKELGPAERQNNLKNAFKIGYNDVKLDTIVIIDDIYTTGSTIDAVSAELRKAGVKRIYFIALASGKGM